MKITIKLPVMFCLVLLIFASVGQKAHALDTGIYAAGTFLEPDVKYQASYTDGTVRKAPESASLFNILYESSSGTLYLNDANICGSSEGAALLINTGNALTINLTGDNRLKSTEAGTDGNTYGLKAEESAVSLTGGGLLSVNVSGIGVQTGDLRINSGTKLEARGGLYGVYLSSGGFEMTDCATRATLYGGIQATNVKPRITGDYSAIVNAGESADSNAHILLPQQNAYHEKPYSVTVVVEPENALAEFTATGYSTGILTTGQENMNYRVDPASAESPFAPLVETVQLDNLREGSTIDVYVSSDLSFDANSDISTITIKRNAKPEAAKQDYKSEEEPGSITLNGAGKYEKLMDDGIWEECGDVFSALQPGKYSFRAAPGGEYLASDILEVEIEDMRPQPATSPTPQNHNDGTDTPTPTTDIPYRFTYNANGSWWYDIGGDYTVQCTGPADLLDGVYINGIKVDPHNYLLGTAKDGSTIITFYEFYMKTLEHKTYQKLSASYSDGKSALTNLHILSKRAAPVTGETFCPAVWIAIMLLSFCSEEVLRRWLADYIKMTSMQSKPNYK